MPENILDDKDMAFPLHQSETRVSWKDDPLQILSAKDLVDHFSDVCPMPVVPNAQFPNRIVVGLVGYPNVGKSSTINAMCGAKRVSVSATPGKTKHFQTLNLTENITLCDCPGLVFPNFASTKAEMVCNGVLPIDQLREYSGPATLVSESIPCSLIENIYGIRIKINDELETGRIIPTGEELCKAYACTLIFSFVSKNHSLVSTQVN
jgi:large subunit GTPase 1